MGTNPFGGDLERLTKHHRHSFRRRVGPYRILFNVDIAARRPRTAISDGRSASFRIV